MTDRKPEKKTALVIEDEPEVRNFVSRLLELEGLLVVQAKDGKEGLVLVRSDHIDMVLLDLRMPGLDGWAVLKQIKDDPELVSVPVIVFTASAADTEREKAITMGAVDYLVKPISAADLRIAITKIIVKGG